MLLLPSSSSLVVTLVRLNVVILLVFLGKESLSAHSFHVVVSTAPVHATGLLREGPTDLSAHHDGGNNTPARGTLPLMSPQSRQQQRRRSRSRMVSTSTSSLFLSSSTGGRSRPHPTTTRNIEYQADIHNYGRGEQHLSACLQQGDVIVYQAGQWWVDGVLVGDDDFDSLSPPSHSSSSTTTSSPTYHYAVVETIQVVWTHNCEHGVIGAWPLTLVRNENDDDDDDGRGTTFTQRFEITDYKEMVQFGPEQLVAKLPCRWEEEGAGTVECPPLQLVLMDERCHQSSWTMGEEEELEEE